MATGDTEIIFEMPCEGIPASARRDLYTQVCENIGEWVVDSTYAGEGKKINLKSLKCFVFISTVPHSALSEERL